MATETNDRPYTPDATAAVAESRVGGRKRAPGQPPLGEAREGRHFSLGPMLTRPARSRGYERKSGDPLYRPLRIYALDPTASRRDGAITVINVPYEPLTPGPVGALLEVLDDQTTSDDATLDLDDHAVLLTQGRAPSPSDSPFRRQMAYAVCATTCAAFRHALGRDIAWGFDRGVRDDDADGPSCARLRIRPNVGGMRNAYYDKQSGELRFGSYRADANVFGRNLPGGSVFGVLSHDIVVHETSHALLDGLRSHFMVPSNQDVLAFHEAFADLIAVFQRFTYKEVVSAGIRNAGGVVRDASLLTQIAVQFGQTMGMTGSLRDAVGGTELRYGAGTAATEPHELGKVLVAAVFEAFASVYTLKASRLLRLATNGTGVLPAGDIPDLLVEFLSETAARLASQFLSVCIRAIDYCPPVDITFGEYLRAVITADYDLVPDDDWGYREAWIDAFRKYGIYPDDVPSLTEDALLWRPPDAQIPAEPGLAFDRLQFAGDPGRPASAQELLRQGRALGALACDPTYCEAFGLVVPGDPRLENDQVDLPVVQSIRTTRRVGPDGQVAFDLVAEVTQRRDVAPRDGSYGFDFYGGATIILDPQGAVRYVVRKSLVNDERLRRQRAHIGTDATFWGDGPFDRVYPAARPFMLLHGVAEHP